MSTDTKMDAVTMQKTLRNCYLIILPNIVWLFIPVFALLTGNNLSWIMAALMVACVFLNISNVYIAKHWYYNHAAAAGSVYQGHFRNVDDIGFVTFFVTMIGSLMFLIASVIVTNVIKSQLGAYFNLALELALAGIYIVLALWVVKRASEGLSLVSKNEPYIVDPKAKLFGFINAGT